MLPQQHRDGHDDRGAQEFATALVVELAQLVANLDAQMKAMGGAGERDANAFERSVVAQAFLELGVERGARAALGRDVGLTGSRGISSAEQKRG